MVGILVIEVFLDWFICISSYMAVMVLVSVIKMIIAIYLIIYVVKFFIIKDRIHEMALGNINCKIDEKDITKGFAGIAKELNNMSEDNIFIEIKNISSDELENTPEELMERFVRGDKSRHTEGNGLGLSIAKGFVEALGGQMSVDIDGDVFKVKFVLNTVE